jgi:phosphatidylserine/phosphatidylglycerophosphate/cardiolipin synthase-like enzyme
VHAAASVGESLRILQPGWNCWCVAKAGRAAVLVDAESYFGRLEQALKAATRSILIIGWDFDAAIRLRPQDGGEQLGTFLRGLVDCRPELEIRILVWNLATLHAPSALFPLLLGERWNDHERITLKLDGDHPLYAAQHEKIVAIDDKVAFVGGMDMTVDRWDTNAHSAEDPRRRTPAGAPYGPVHDIQMLVDRDAARAVADCARDHWRIVTGEVVAPAYSESDPWPPDLNPDFTDVSVAIARTRPTWRAKKGTHEIAQLTRDAISAARRSIYIEAQYFTDFSLGEIIAGRLREPHGPQVIVVVTRMMHGFIEGVFMNGNRRRLIRLLQRSDHFDRLRLYHPVVPSADGDCEVLIHAKLVIVDDVFLRVGSSNLNNRSAGLDMECDLAIEADDAVSRAGVARIRARLLAEHFDKAPDLVLDAIATEGESPVKAMERLNHSPRGLRAFEVPQMGPTTPIPGTRLLDPRAPLPFFSPLHRWARMRRRGPATAAKQRS